ncbi:hypothetical protein AEA09_10360 [Lysinibacillus contaminans]|uniref:DUF3889 domain-containing protein n=1 Tax=Lysinibacillus contaminans TaxID=1293441 RepID=A0ABR5K2D5_9BACI|nr:DUF3889 domain-containing protein [Lysinibacillus contaminans]KOS68905.1 hypothetical protein AEA09_10360 [Lysinibacillus contaminans]
MRKTFIALGICITLQAVSAPIPAAAHAQQEIPTYAKWGKLAIKEAQSKYPNAKIIDYLHVGRESKADLTIEKFKLWLKEGDKEFGVHVSITFATKTENVVTVEMQKTDR